MTKYKVIQKNYPVTNSKMWFTQKRFMFFFWRNFTVGDSGVYHQSNNAYKALRDNGFISENITSRELMDSGKDRNEATSQLHKSMCGFFEKHEGISIEDIN